MLTRNRVARISPAILLSALLPLIAPVITAAESPATATNSTAAVAAGPLVPLPGPELGGPRVVAAVPALTEKQLVRMQTSVGDVLIEVYPQAAPNAVQRFVELVQSGFYDNTPVSRVVPGFVAQFGINWRAPHKDWEEKTFDDDPTLFTLDRGTLAFAKGGIDNNSTQVFINYAENSRLAARQYNFTTFGKVVNGMDVVDKFVDVGEPGMGLDQERLWDDGEAYLASLTVKPTMILHMALVKTK